MQPARQLFLGWLEAVPDSVGWFGWYVLVAGDEGATPVLVGGGGFMGPPRDGVVRIVAETEWANPAPVRVPEKAGFAFVGPAAEPGGTRFELSGSAATAELFAPADTPRPSWRDLFYGQAHSAWFES